MQHRIRRFFCLAGLSIQEIGTGLPRIAQASDILKSIRCQAQDGSPCFMDLRPEMWYKKIVFPSGVLRVISAEIPC
ncbi:MAG TPA: hypothetical protein DCZ61_02855 [Lachnospiraceae bacterium]|nr:hypothetical protein [Lachnospiraceae bacterium]